MNRRMQRLNAAVHDLGETGFFADFDDTVEAASRSARQVPPVERISTPNSASPEANGIKPCLSDTLKSARRTVNIDSPEISS